MQAELVLDALWGIWIGREGGIDESEESRSLPAEGVLEPAD